MASEHRPNSVLSNSTLRLVIADSDQLTQAERFIRNFPNNIISSSLSVQVGVIQISLSWAVVSDATSYQIERSLDGENWNNRVSSESNSAVITDLDINTEYYFRVRASNTNGESDWTDGTFTLTTQNASAPVAPSIVLNSYSGTSVSGSITIPVNNSGSDITSYKIYLENSSGVVIRNQTFEPSDNFTLTGLIISESYSIRAVSINEAGEGTSSESVNLIPSLRSPSNQSGITISGNNLMIQYIDESISNNNYLPVTSFQLEITNSSNVVSTHTLLTNEASLESLSIGMARYIFRFRVRNAIGFGAYSNSYTIAISSPPEKPEVPKVFSRSRHIDILLLPSNDNGSTITGYTVSVSYVDSDDITQLNSYSVSAQGKTYTIQNAKPGTAYSIYYTVNNKFGSSERSETVTHKHISRIISNNLQRSKYNIRILNHNGEEAISMSDSEIIELEYDKMYNDSGSFNITMTGFLAEWFENNLILPDGLDYFVDINRLNPGKKFKEVDDTFLYRYLNIYYTADNTLYAIIGGPSLNEWFKNSIIYPYRNPYSARGRWTDAGEASQVMNNLIEYNLGKSTAAFRKPPIPMTIIPYGDGSLAGGDWGLTDNLYDVLIELSRKGNVQFQILHIGHGNIQCRIGKLYKDRTKHSNFGSTDYTLLKRERGNLREQSLIIDYLNVKNIAYVVRSGEISGEESVARQESTERYDVSPYNYIEFTEEVSATDEQVANIEVLTKGASALATNSPKEELDFPIDNRHGLLYKKDWDVGDIVTAEWKNYSKNFRIVGAQISYKVGEETITIRTDTENIRQFGVL